MLPIESTSSIKQDLSFVLTDEVLVHPFTNPPKRNIIVPPGSKSISNRALILAALGNGTVRVKICYIQTILSIC